MNLEEVALQLASDRFVNTAEMLIELGHHVGNGFLDILMTLLATTVAILAL